VENNQFLADYAHAKMAGRIRERYRIEPKILLPFILKLNDENKINITILQRTNMDRISLCIIITQQ